MPTYQLIGPPLLSSAAAGSFSAKTYKLPGQSLRGATQNVRFGCLAHRVPYRRSHPGLRLDASGGDSASQRGVVFFVLLGVCVCKAGYGVVELGRVA